MGVWIRLDRLAECTGIDAEATYGDVLSRSAFVLVNLDGSVEADLPGGWSVIGWGIDPSAYPAAVSGVLEYYDRGDGSIVPGEFRGDVWADVIDPLLSPAESNMPENLGRGARFVHARHLFWRESVQGLRGHQRLVWNYQARDEHGGVPDSPTAGAPPPRTPSLKLVATDRESQP